MKVSFFETPQSLQLMLTRNKRYTERFLEKLGSPDDGRVIQEKVQALANAFRGALTQDGLMCLCGVLGAEISGLPKPVVLSARSFFDSLCDWLMKAFASSNTPNPRRKTLRILATLEGALLVARTLEDVDAFDEAVADLQSVAAVSST